MAPTSRSDKTPPDDLSSDDHDNQPSKPAQAKRKVRKKKQSVIKSKVKKIKAVGKDVLASSTDRQLRTRPEEFPNPNPKEMMAELPLTCTKFELRCVMRFLCALGVSPTEIDRQLKIVYGKRLSRGVVFKWCQQFRNGRSTLEDEKRSGRPRNEKVHDSRADIMEYLRSNRHAKLRELAFHVTLPATTMFHFIKNTLKFRMFLGCWVPKELSEENKEERLKFCTTNLARCKSENLSSYINRIVVADQTWIYFHTTPLNKRLPPMKNEEGEVIKRKKQHRLKWTLETGPSPAITLLMTVFWDCNGVVAIDFKDAESLTSSNGNYRYSDKSTLQMLYNQICAKRPGLLLTGLTLLMNEDLTNEDKRVNDETGDTITSRLTSFGWQGLFNPHSSPDLSPSDYHLFQPLKKHISGKRFTDVDSGKRCVLEWLWAQDSEFFTLGVHDLATRWEKCIKAKGDHLDK